jgi:hypothetical protein
MTAAAAAASNKMLPVSMLHCALEHIAASCNQQRQRSLLGRVASLSTMHCLGCNHSNI